jgi:hypothetical protein
MEQLTTGWLAVGFLIALVVTLVLARGFVRYELASVATPSGILDLELAGNAQSAGRMMTAWRLRGLLVRARPNLWLDMAWIPCYVATMLFGCLLAARAFPGELALLGWIIAAGQVLAGVLDYVENFALLRALRVFEQQPEQLNDRLLGVAAGCARLKLRLLTIGAVYSALGWSLYLLG